MGIIWENRTLRTASAAQSHDLAVWRTNNIISECRTNDKGLFWLSAVLVIPGRAASGVDGACACAEQRRLCFTQRGSALPARGPSRGQEAVQRVLPAPTAKTANSRAGHSLNKRSMEGTGRKLSQLGLWSYYSKWCRLHSLISNANVYLFWKYLLGFSAWCS